MAGVDCGFSVHVGMQGIDPEVAWAKLRVLAQGAEIATRRLWVDSPSDGSPGASTRCSRTVCTSTGGAGSW